MFDHVSVKKDVSVKCICMSIFACVCSSDAYAAYFGIHVFISAICTYSAHLNLHLATCANIC